MNKQLDPPMDPPLGYVSPEEVLARHASIGADMRDERYGNARGGYVLSSDGPPPSLRPPARACPPERRACPTIPVSSLVAGVGAALHPLSDAAIMAIAGDAITNYQLRLDHGKSPARAAVETLQALREWMQAEGEA